MQLLSVSSQGKKMEHKGKIWGTYVLPEYRGHGIGRKLLDEIISRSKRIEGICQVNLGVITFNEAAMKLYESYGFKSYGLEINSMKHNGTYFDEQLMTYHFYEP
ncbi:GNAT family N-acetyltransferase [Paenibacillus swuensis]|uniref:GNAT family N-acetyltransferase n=1 Tax=Paenibacillus swuensis TaxID=1178515 RepID=UPI0018D39416|nr:N-acetyltransferase [Paenibacillus swuensis]